VTPVPTVGVEEEFLLVDPETGAPVGANRSVAENAAGRDVKLQLELTSCQVETTTPVSHTSAQLRSELMLLRHVAAESATAAGARLLAVGVPPLASHEFPITDSPRYRAIAGRFGLLAEEAACGCHVHVAVPSRQDAIRVSNRLRPWLPLLLALTANSAFYGGADTGYSSWRSVVWARWPSAGPPPHFESVAEYDAMVGVLQHSGAMLDDGMVYWDVRPSANFPTVEVRVSDVPATVDETVLLATLIRACVMTALADGSGVGLPRIAPYALRAAYWKAARDGLAGDAVDLGESHACIPAAELLAKLIEHVRPALDELGDYGLVRTEFARIRSTGNGAIRQRRAWARRHAIADVIDEATAATVAG
jgi:glutamate---cysteine ligase / carboxylate-amine ligase